MSVTPSGGSGKGGNRSIVADSSVSAGGSGSVLVVMFARRSSGDVEGEKSLGVVDYLESWTRCGRSASRALLGWPQSDRRRVKAARSPFRKGISRTLVGYLSEPTEPLACRTSVFETNHCTCKFSSGKVK